MTAEQLTPPTRKLSEGESEQFLHTSYLLIARTHHCATCNAIQHYSDFFEVHTHPTKTALSNAKILKPATSHKTDMPMAHVTNPVVSVPICHECADWATKLHGFKTAVGPVSYAAWADTIQRKALDDRAAATAAAKVKNTPTLDQL